MQSQSSRQSQCKVECNMPDSKIERKSVYDPISDHSKRVPKSSWLEFILCVLIVLPITLFFLIPSAAFFAASTAFFGCCSSRKKKSRKKDSDLAKADDVTYLDDRNYSFVVYGATGFTGNLVAQYMAKKHKNSSIKWAIAGRRQGRLEDIRSELTKIDPKLVNLPILIVDARQPATLDAMANDTRVVISTVGPFAVYGEPLVRACCRYGTSYADSTGESDWVRAMIDKYEDLARETGARIVSFTGHDCVPWDLMVHKLSQQMRLEHGQNLKAVDILDEVRASASGGTLATFVESIANRQSKGSSLGFDPLLKNLAGVKSTFKVVPKVQLLPAVKHGRRVGFFVMSMVMANCIRRSNAINEYAKKLVYKESLVFPDFKSAVVSTLQIFSFLAALSSPPLAKLVQMFLPKPGTGPSMKQMKRGFLKLTAWGVGEQGAKIKAALFFPVDPGYYDTARMVAESGLALAEGKGLTQAGGIWTPAAVMTDVLMDRLVETGTEFVWMEP